jgi:hypothetical protein
MEARATLRGAQASTGALVVVVASLFAALLLGFVAGYVLRGSMVITAPSGAITAVQSTASQGGSDSDPTRVLPTPFVTEPAPYSTPSPKPVPSPTYDAAGNLVPI